jgi:hypothetical protein
MPKGAILILRLSSFTEGEIELHRGQEAFRNTFQISELEMGLSNSKFISESSIYFLLEK